MANIYDYGYNRHFLKDLPESPVVYDYIVKATEGSTIPQTANLKNLTLNGRTIPRIIELNSAQASVTEAPSERLLRSTVIPGGIMGFNGCLRITALVSTGGALNSNGLRLRWGGTNYSIHETSTAGDEVSVKAYVTNRDSRNSQVIWAETQEIPAGTSGSANDTGGQFTTSSVDTGQDQTIGLSFNSSVNATYTVEFWLVELLNV